METRGVKKGTIRGNYKENKKEKRFLTYRVTDEEFDKLNQIFIDYQKKYNLNKVEALKQIFFKISEIENI